MGALIAAVEWSIVIPAAIALASGVFTVVYGNRKGLPEARAELTALKDELVDTLKDQLDAARTEARAAKDAVAECRPQLEAAQRKITGLERENLEMWREIRRLGGTGPA